MLPLLLFCPFIKAPKIVIILSILLYTLFQVLWKINNDHCLWTEMVNKIIDKDRPHRKWRASFPSFIHHYMRGDEWAYSNIFKHDKTPEFLYNIVIHCVIVFYILRM
jgi:hypothetical protein